ncbi:MAG: hypothetical protein KTQ13_03665 [Ferruginibacter sp.]|nr:hypothetical protein [Chitinophagaceae bacterium]MBP6285484.1 hypothetical protein [Ferruginibacter sp.]MBU9935724.1 hypothetical protein [Ferruginibacter sp.]HQY12836.1 hypothetical protein [Ferruginibacter sp.]
MKWVSVNNGSANETFELWEANEKLANISFSGRTRFARMVSRLGKRIFSFEDRGLFSPRKLIRNEYGIGMGKVEELKPGSGKGFVEMDEKKYFFVYNQDNSGELTLYDESMQKNLLSCSFNSINHRLSKTKSLLTEGKFASLLLVLCWYAFQPHSASSAPGIAKQPDLMLP